MSTIPSRRIECRDDVRGDNLLIVFIFVVIVIAIIFYVEISSCFGMPAGENKSFII